MVKLADAQAAVEALQRERDTARRRVDELEAREVDVVLLRDDLDAERDRLRANLVNCVARLEAYYGEDYPAVRDAKAALTPAGEDGGATK